ncbi:hypothetical protein [Bacillus sp. FJAT-27245]|uniref:hypothetical protein n=1 Tax=Bacillus sp. FJAT-27245 TaxID=1684144 RepID=UPI000A7CC432|nr:hypothetical protein [Bacillus sp. FJAT-27245]
MRKIATAGLAALALMAGAAGCSSDFKKEDNKPVMNEKGTKESDRKSNDTGK